VTRFGGKNVLVEPLVEREIVGDTAEEAHSGVSVAIDQARHDDGGVRVDYLWRLVLRLDLDRFSNRRDGIAANCNGTVIDDATLRVHGDDGAVDDKKVCFILREAWRCH